MDPTSLRVLVVEDHPMVRRSVALALEDSPWIEIVGEAASGPEALDRAAELEPDVVLLDLGLPGMDGIEVLRRLKEMGSSSRVVVLTAHDDPEMLFESMRLEVVGYLDKGLEPDTIQAAIESVGRGESVITPDQERIFLARLNAFVARSRDSNDRLTERELDVLKLLVEGHTNYQIGRALHLSDRTVETHVSRIYRKLGVGGRLEALGRARELHLI